MFIDSDHDVACGDWNAAKEGVKKNNFPLSSPKGLALGAPSPKQCKRRGIINFLCKAPRKGVFQSSYVNQLPIRNCVTL